MLLRKCKATRAPMIPRMVPTVPINTNYIEPYDIVNFMTSPRTMCYKNWLKTPVRDMNEDWTFDNGNDYTHLHFIRDFYNDLLKVIQDSGYDIDDEISLRRLRKELADPLNTVQAPATTTILNRLFGLAKSKP
mgnify:CR=1 FL=1